MESSLAFKEVEIKLLIMYLLNKMELPMSRAQISDFINDKQLLDNFTIEVTLADMEVEGFLDSTTENAMDVSTTRYTLTDDGYQNLEYFENHIPKPVRMMINKYVEETQGKIRRDYEITASYFPNVEDNDYKVKCAVFDDKRVLLEFVVSVDTRDQAKFIQANWRTNASKAYKKIFEALTEKHILA